MLHDRQGMLMDCFIAFGATLSVPFQTDSVFPDPKEKAPLVLLRTLDSSNPAADGRAAAAGLANLPAGHPLGSWLFLFPPSPIRLNEIEPFVGLEVVRVQPTPSPGTEELK